MASLSSNLKNLMSVAHINASELARRTGIAQPIIHRLSTGQNTNPKLATIKPVARYFMVSVSQLIGEDPLPLPKEQVFPLDLDESSPAELRGWNRVPLISWKDALNWPENLKQYQNSNDVAYIPTDANVSKLAYSLQIKRYSINDHPLLPDGTTIIVEPKRSPQDGDFVVVCVKGEDEPCLRQVLIKGNDRFLKSFSSADEVKLSPFNDADTFLGVMAQAKLNY